MPQPCNHSSDAVVGVKREDARSASGPGFAGCGKTTVIADPLEQFIAAGVLHRLESPRLPEAITRAPDRADGRVAG